MALYSQEDRPIIAINYAAINTTNKKLTPDNCSASDV
jgi:hypothetical protein